jgi:hypothetical protein
LYNLGIELIDRFDDFIDYTGLNLYKTDRMYIGPCPIHDGDNPSAINLFHTGLTCSGNWKCRTHNCEKYFLGSVIGFVRGYLSRTKYNWPSGTASFGETLQFIRDFVNNTPQSVDKPIYIPPPQIKVPRAIVRTSLKIPSEYFLKRGLNRAILDRYDVGDCLTAGKKMSCRAVVPVYDENHHFMIGCSGRSIYETCQKCKAYHSPIISCPTKELLPVYSKWKNTTFSSGKKSVLYNLWYAKKYIAKSGIAVLVEGPGNVWKMEENGINLSLSLLGRELYEEQVRILEQLGVITLITILDNDTSNRENVGQLAAQDIRDKYKHKFNIFNIVPSQNDVGNMTNNEIQAEIKPQIDTIYKKYAIYGEKYGF